MRRADLRMARKGGELFCPACENHFLNVWRVGLIRVQLVRACEKTPLLEIKNGKGREEGSAIADNSDLLK